MHWFSAVSLASSLSLVGCSWVNNRSDFERDPFVMSHLTHHKNDPLYAGSESENAFEEEPRLQSASVSRKLPTRSSARGSHERMAYQEEKGTPTRSADFQWIEGRLTHRNGKNKGWFLRYATDSSQDPYQGELPLGESPRLGLAREGDRVRLEGKLVPGDAGVNHYEIDSISVID